MTKSCTSLTNYWKWNELQWHKKQGWIHLWKEKIAVGACTKPKIRKTWLCYPHLLWSLESQKFNPLCHGCNTSRLWERRLQMPSMSLQTCKLSSLQSVVLSLQSTWPAGWADIISELVEYADVGITYNITIFLTDSQEAVSEEYMIATT